MVKDSANLENRTPRNRAEKIIELKYSNEIGDGYFLKLFSRKKRKKSFIVSYHSKTYAFARA